MPTQLFTCCGRAPSKPTALLLSFLIVSLTVSLPSTLAQTYQIGYDPNGNRGTGFNYIYEYNSFNQLVRVRNDSGTPKPILEEYTYDENGRRLKKHEPQKNQTTYYVSENWVRVVNSSGTFDTLYVHHNGQLIARKDPDGSKFFYHPDHLGSTTLITNQSGQVVEEITYEPFGNQFSGGSDRFLYTGKELDTGTGLQYYGARYYDPPYGVFTQPDSILPDPYDPQQFNRYAYVRNNPYRYTDPSGNILVTAVVLASVVIPVAWSAYSQYVNTNTVDTGRLVITGYTAAAGTFIVATAGISLVGAYGLRGAITEFGISSAVSGILEGIITPEARERFINTGDLSELYNLGEQQVGWKYDFETGEWIPPPDAEAGSDKEGDTPSDLKKKATDDELVNNPPIQQPEPPDEGVGGFAGGNPFFPFGGGTTDLRTGEFTPFIFQD